MFSLHRLLFGHSPDWGWCCYDFITDRTYCRKCKRHRGEPWDKYHYTAMLPDGRIVHGSEA